MEDNYFAGVGAIVLKEDKVLLVRHTYGSAAGKLLNPGGFIHKGELPYEAIQRKVLEETGITIRPSGFLSIRCSQKDWYMAFLADYVSGETRSDDDENSEAVFLDCDEALQRPDVTETAKTLLRLALDKKPLPQVNSGKGRVSFSIV